MNNISKHGKTFKIGALLLVVALISTVMISGTFAKYTSEYAGQDTALVAKWDFKVTDGTTDLGGAEVALDLFTHAYDKNINQKNGNDYIIAPGVNDEFTIEMSFLSDVDAKVTVDFVKDCTVANNLPIEYSVDGGTTWVDTDGLSESFVAAVVDHTSATPATTPDNTFTFAKSDVTATGATVITQTVKWRWAFERGANDTEKATNSVIDTGFGNTSVTDDRSTYILNVKVLAEQIAPETI